MSIEDRFFEYQSTIEYHAKKYGAINKVPYADMFQQGVVVFYNCVDKYDPCQKVTFKTYLSGALEKELRRYASNYRQKTSIDTDPLIIVPTYRYVETRNPEATVLFKDFLSSLSEEAENILRLLLTESQDLGFEETDPSRKMRGKLRKYAHEHLGMPQRKIDSLFKEIKTFTKTALESTS